MKQSSCLVALAAVAVAVPMVAAPAANAEEMKMSAKMTQGRTAGGFTGATTLTRYTNTPKAHILAEGYKDISTSPFGLSFRRGLGGRTEVGVAVGGGIALMGAGPGISLGVSGKHLLMDMGKMGLSVYGRAQARGLGSAATTIPLFVSAPFTMDFGPRNSLTLAPGGGITLGGATTTMGASLNAGYEWRFMDWASFLLLDDVDILPAFNNTVSVGVRLAYDDSFFADTSLLSLTGPASSLQLGLLGASLAWVGQPKGMMK